MLSWRSTISILSCLTYSVVLPLQKPAPLQSELIKLIDGSSIGIDGSQIKLMLHVLLKLKKISEESSYHSFGGKHVSLQELVDAENAVEHAWAEQKKAHPTHDAYYHGLEKKYLSKKNSLTKALETAKQDFDKKIATFMNNAQGAKAALLVLIEQACKQRHRDQSFLLAWGKAEEGHETDALYAIPTFKEFQASCDDLIYFLQVMIVSCPKAVAQYQLLKAQGH